jgi:hypothetical protein
MAQTYSPQDYPATELSNGVLRAKVYLPDAQKGFYRGTRFDWAGVMGSLGYKGHSYFGPFFEKFDPAVEDVEIGNPIKAGINSAARNSLGAMARRSDMPRRSRVEPSVRSGSDLCARSITRRTAPTSTIRLWMVESAP